MTISYALSPAAGNNVVNSVRSEAWDRVFSKVWASQRQVSPFHASVGPDLTFLENLEQMFISVSWHSRVCAVVAVPPVYSRGCFYRLCAEGNLGPGSRTLLTLDFNGKKVLTRSNILTPFSLTTSLEEFLFMVFLVFYEYIMSYRGRRGQVEKAKMKGGVCRAELCFPWPIGRNGQRRSGARRAVNLTVPSCLLVCFPGKRGDGKGVSLRPWARILHLRHCSKLFVCTEFEPNPQSVWKFLGPCMPVALDNLHIHVHLESFFWLVSAGCEG